MVNNCSDNKPPTGPAPPGAAAHLCAPSGPNDSPASGCYDRKAAEEPFWTSSSCSLVPRQEPICLRHHSNTADQERRRKVHEPIFSSIPTGAPTRSSPNPLRGCATPRNTRCALRTHSLFPAQRIMHARKHCALTRRRMRNSTCDSKSIAHCLVMDCATVSWEKMLRRLERIIAFHRSEGY